MKTDTTKKYTDLYIEDKRIEDRTGTKENPFASLQQALIYAKTYCNDENIAIRYTDDRLIAWADSQTFTKLGEFIYP